MTAARVSRRGRYSETAQARASGEPELRKTVRRVREAERVVAGEQVQAKLAHDVADALAHQEAAQEPAAELAAERLRDRDLRPDHSSRVRAGEALGERDEIVGR